MKEQLRAAIIEWLGETYTDNPMMRANPDYRTAEDVDELLRKLLEIIGL